MKTTIGNLAAAVLEEKHDTGSVSQYTGNRLLGVLKLVNDHTNLTERKLIEIAKRLTHNPMRTETAIQWVRDHNDDDVLDDHELEQVFAAIFGRPPTDDDREQGLWSHVCAAVD